MARIQRNLARKSQNFENIDKELAYSVWMIEKEFGFLITEDFLLMKFFNLVDEYNIKRYNDSVESSIKDKSRSNTFR